MNEAIVTFQELVANLITTPTSELHDKIQAASAHIDAIIVLDDDPTGTQTVYDVPVLTTWLTADIQIELELGTPLFYILTNSRSLNEAQAIRLARAIGENIRDASHTQSKSVMVISRSDSTLRGHYPAEVTALEAGLGMDASVHFIIPAFFEGGRYTINDIHYVKDGEQMIPAAKTPFAEDPVFGYQSSDLKKWVAEKTEGKVSNEQVKSITLADLRDTPFDTLLQKINSLQNGEVCIVNAVDYQDLQTLALAVLQSPIDPIFRTAASFVAVLAAKPPKPLLVKKDLQIDPAQGGLIVVGSYVDKTTRQLTYLLETDIQSMEVEVAALLAGHQPSAKEVAKQIDTILQRGENIVLYTSRELIANKGNNDSLDIGQMVSQYLTDIVSHLTQRPAYILAKGGITSSDIATQGLRVKKAKVTGQISAGVPVWELGAESKFPGLPYIIFPGNVGNQRSLLEVVQRLSI